MDIKNLFSGRMPSFKIYNKYGSILMFFGIILYLYIILNIYDNINVHTLYYHRIIRERLAYLVYYAIIGMLFLFILIVSGKFHLHFTVFFKSSLLSFLLFLLAFAGDHTVLTEHFPFLGIFFVGKQISGLYKPYDVMALVLIIIFIQILYKLDINSYGYLYLKYYVLILLVSFALSPVIIGIIYLIGMVIPILFLDFGDATIIPQVIFSILFVSSTSIRLISKYWIKSEDEAFMQNTHRASQSKTDNGEENNAFRFSMKYVRELFGIEILVLLFTLIPALWMASVFVIDFYDGAYPQEITSALLWFTFLLGIPYSIYQSLPIYRLN